MSRKKTYITVTDQFCGAGGSSLGATTAGAELRLALNHWKLAIETHNTNFPNAAHDCTDISACDPRRYPSTDILITSPECTNHSLANGKRKPSNQSSMFDATQSNPAEERSRATMWDVPRFAEYHNYRIIIVENVVDARKWVMWDAWLLAMHSLGYDHQTVYLNSMHAHPTPQSRDRMYVVFWKRGNRKPNLNITPRAHCAKCGGDVESVQSWKPGRASGRYRKQYAYCCPRCASVVEPYYHAAFNAIDWRLPAPRIGDREKPLKEATMRRIRVGLEKFGGMHLMAMKDSAARDWSLGLDQPLTTVVASASQHALVIDLAWAHGKNNRTSRVSDALPTQTTCQSHGVVVPPFLVETKFSGDNSDRSAALRDAMPTQTAQQTRALITPPFLTSYYGTNEGSPLDEAMPTVTTKDRHAVVVPSFILSAYTRVSGQRAAVSDIGQPMPTVPGRAVHYVVQPFIMNAQSDNQPTGLHEAMRTMLATGNHKWLVEPTKELRVEDCGFRMLEPHECQAAMAFPDTYRVMGNKRERIKQLGNAVTPPVMNILVQRCIDSLR